jgi:hypothetical protein
MSVASTKKKSNRGGRRVGAGPPFGRKLPAVTIERLRASINTKLCIDTLHEMAQVGGQHDGVRVSAAKVLLDRVLPTLQATDLTSGGESLTIERVSFKPTTGAKK